MTCECIGLKSVIEVYPDDQGPGEIIINGEVTSGTRHTIKEVCHVCGETLLRIMTFPDCII